MYNENGQLRNLSSRETGLYFIAGLLFNAVGNGLTVATNMGSAPWTASAANLANATGLSISVFLFAYGLIAAILSCVLLKSIDWPRVIGNLLFVLTFSVIIGFVSSFFAAQGIGDLPMPTRLLMDLIAIVSVGCGVSITQRLQFILHPLDDLTNLTRFMFFKGNAGLAQIVNFAIPMVISLAVWAFTGNLVAVNLGTLVSFFFQGVVIGYADKTVFSHLDHKLKLNN